MNNRPAPAGPKRLRLLLRVADLQCTIAVSTQSMTWLLVSIACTEAGQLEAVATQEKGSGWWLLESTLDGLRTPCGSLQH